MARVCGHSGAVTLGNTIGGVTEWTFSPVINTPDATGMDSGQYGEHVEGLKRATISVTGFWVSGDPPPSIKTGGKISFQLDGDGTPTYRVAGSAYINSAPVTTNVDDTSAFTIEATVTGSWTETTMYETSLT